MSFKEKKMYIDIEKLLFQEMKSKNFPNWKRVQSFRLKGLRVKKKKDKKQRMRNSNLETFR